MLLSTTYKILQILQGNWNRIWKFKSNLLLGEIRIRHPLAPHASCAQQIMSGRPEGTISDLNFIVIINVIGL